MPLVKSRFWTDCICLYAGYPSERDQDS
jgi:hypothetical protein